MTIPELLLLGGPNSGKTHYAGQLYGRLRRSLGTLQLRPNTGTPDDLSALEEVLRSLEEGNAAKHTPANTWAEIQLHLMDQHGKHIDLNWPDYGGEKLSEITEHRTISELWQSRLSVANGWLLLIRLRAETTYKDELENLLRRENGTKRTIQREKSWDANARIVELLQMLMHIAQVETNKRVQRPCLAVLLSCYDELDAPSSIPSEVLAQHLPLVSSFIHNNWAPNDLSIWGLSSLGCLLEENTESETFIDEGPETQGWVVPPEGGERDSDLSKPLAWLLDRL